MANPELQAKSLLYSAESVYKLFRGQVELTKIRLASRLGATTQCEAMETFDTISQIRQVSCKLPLNRAAALPQYWKNLKDCDLAFGVLINFSDQVSQPPLST